MVLRFVCLFTLLLYSSFHEVGVWRRRIGDKENDNMNRLLFPDIVNLYRNFQDRHLVSAAVDNWPFFGLKHLDNGTVIGDKGIDISIINTLGYYLNFTWVFSSHCTPNILLEIECTK